MVMTQRLGTEAVSKPAARPPGVRAKRAAWPLDGRTREGRKLRGVVRSLADQVGVVPAITVTVHLIVLRGGRLQGIGELYALSP